MMNDTIKIIKERYSCRSYNGIMPSDEILKEIAEAAVCSPSGINRQNWRVIVVKDKQLIADMEAEGMKVLADMQNKAMLDRIMSRSGKLYYNAPCMIMMPILAAQPSGAELLDVGILSQTVALSATSLGVDNVICGLAGLCFAADKAGEFKQRLGFPNGYEFGCAVLLGYAVDKTAPHEPDLAKISFIG